MLFENFLKIYFYSLFFFYPLSFKYFDQLIFYQVYFLAIILFLKILVKKEILKIPKKITYLWFFYSFFYLISCFLSTDKLMSFKHFFLSQSVFFIFIYFFNQPNLLKNIINKKFFYFFSLIFINSLLFKDQLLSLIFIKKSDYNFFYSHVEKHNHLGDFLGLSLIISLIKNNYLLSLIFFIFLIISHSRSAFFSFFLTIFFYLKTLDFFRKNQYWWKNYLLIFLLIFLNLSIFYYQRFDIFNSRQYYFLQGLSGFLEKPIFGWGYGNFINISLKYSVFFHNPYNQSLTGVAHNIFLENLTGLGIFSFVFFVLLIYEFLKNAQKNTFFYLFLYLLVLFQFDYIYVMPNLYLLFLILPSLFYKEKS